MNTKIAALATSFVLLAGVAVASSAVQRGERPQEHRGPRPLLESLIGHGGDGPLVRMRARHERMRGEVARRIAERLGVTDKQREHLRTQAEAVKPVVESAHAEARRILDAARERARTEGPQAAREWARREFHALLERTFAMVQPNARSVVERLTPEQRAKIEAFAKLRGRELDEKRLERGAAWLLARRARDLGTGPARPSTPHY